MQTQKDDKYNFTKKGSLTLLTFPSIESTGIVDHFFTTKPGGVSTGSYSSLNGGHNTADDQENIHRNRLIIEKICGYYPKESIILEHGKNIHLIDDSTSLSETVTADAVITKKRGVPLVIYYADCVPVFLVDPKEQAIALIHAGWRGTVMEICKETISEMKKQFNTKPENILAGIAPSIGPCCFETGSEVWSMFGKVFKKLKDLNIFISNNSGGNDKRNINLWEFNRFTLIESGVKKENISVAQICTSCTDDLFFSYRRDQKITGRMAALIALR